MFASAYEIASKFTKPVIVSMRHMDGSVVCSIGAFTILNSEGWMITAEQIKTQKNRPPRRCLRPAV